MNCDEARPLVDSYADNELDLVNSVELGSHIDECQACENAYSSKIALKAALSDSSLYFRAPAGLRTRVRSSLRNEERTGFAGLSRWRWTPVFGAAALVLVVLIVSVAVLRRNTLNSDDLIATEMVSAHIRSMMVDHVTDVASTDQHTVKPWFEGKLDYSPPVKDLGAEGFPLIGGRLDYVGGRSVAALVYQRRRHVINVFVFPGPGTNDTTATTSERQGFNLVRWTRNGMSFCAVSDLNTTELNDFVRKLQS